MHDAVAEVPEPSAVIVASMTRDAWSIAAVFVPDVHDAMAASAVVPFVPYLTLSAHVAVPAAVLMRLMVHRNRCPTTSDPVGSWNRVPPCKTSAPAVSAVSAVAGVPSP